MKNWIKSKRKRKSRERWWTVLVGRNGLTRTNLTELISNSHWSPLLSWSQSNWKKEKQDKQYFNFNPSSRSKLILFLQEGQGSHPIRNIPFDNFDWSLLLDIFSICTHCIWSILIGKIPWNLPDWTKSPQIIPGTFCSFANNYDCKWFVGKS